MKPNVYSQLLIMIVFATKYREHFLKKEFRTDVWKYISKTVTGLNHKSLIVNGVEDHVHILVGLKPFMSISDLVKEIKRSSTDFINEKKWTRKPFLWQGSYGAFSYSQSHLHRIYNYIANQEEHHRKVSFKQEYLKTLESFKIEYDEKYLFEWI